MNRLLILLCMVGWSFYVVQANKGGDLAQNAKAYAEPLPAGQPAVLPIQSEFQPISAAQSPHAITPDETPRQARNSLASPPQLEPTENPKLLPEANHDPASPPELSQEQQLRVTSETSIRSGPSDSAHVIGRAHAGAELRVKSRDAGWVQFFDPAAKKSGWISLANLAPADDSISIQSTVPKRSKQALKATKLKSPKPIPKAKQLLPSYAELPSDREFVPPRRGGLFGLFWKRRLSDLPPPY